MTQQLWNREELYAEVWEQPATKLAEKYGISDVAIGKICRKLKVPVPGRGYWARKQSGQNPKRLPLPRFDNPPRLFRPIYEPKPKLEAESSDPEVAKIAEVEAAPVVVPAEEDKLVTTARRVLSRAKVDEYGRVQRPPSQSCLDVRVSKDLLDRALAVMNMILITLESRGMVVKVADTGTSVEVFGQTVRFGIEEDLEVKERRGEEQPWGGTKKVVVHERSGRLAFRIASEGSGLRRHWSDGKSKRLEALLPKCLGGLLRVARHSRLEAEERRRWYLEWKRQERERAERIRRAQEEEARTRNIEECTANWHRAKRMREFIVAFERACEARGEPTDPTSPNGQWIAWARAKADSFDPLVKKGSTGGETRP